MTSVNETNLPTTMSIQNKADLIISEIDSILHHCEQNSVGEGIGFLDILRIIERVNYHFSNNNQQTPDIILSALNEAQSMCSPASLVETENELTFKGIATTIVGGLIFIYGIMNIYTHGATERAPDWHWYDPRTYYNPWGKLSPNDIIAINWGYAIALFIGGIILVSGIYILSTKISQKKNALLAFEKIRNSIINWRLRNY